MARTKPAESVYLATNGWVVSLDAATGRENWRRKIPGCGEVISLVVRDDGLFLGSRGNVWKLNPKDGAEFWHNPLPGLGFHYVSLGADSTIAMVNASQQAAAQQAAAASVAVTAAAAS